MNAFRNRINQSTIYEIAVMMVKTGLASYGYQYVNMDSGWQGVYDEESVSIQPHAGFPDMKALVDSIHNLGLRTGIYSTPMLRAWGGGDYPGCTHCVLTENLKYATFGQRKNCQTQRDALHSILIRIAAVLLSVENKNYKIKAFFILMASCV